MAAHPTFSPAVRLSTDYSPWTLAPDMKVATVGDECVTLNFALAGFIQQAMHRVVFPEDHGLDQGQVDAVEVGNQRYLQAVLGDLQDSLTGGRAAGERKDTRGKGEEGRMVGLQAEVPDSVRCCAIRVAGGWNHDPHDQRVFYRECQAAGTEPYSWDQFSELGWRDVPASTDDQRAGAAWLAFAAIAQGQTPSWPQHRGEHNAIRGALITLTALPQSPDTFRLGLKTWVFGFVECH